MKRGFYFRLALDGMRKNKKLYIPYLLTCSGMVMMMYIISGLSRSPLLDNMRGGNTIAVVLTLGTIVIAMFSLLFLFYTNSFLTRRRNKEFGLYNILGMNKGNISRILLWETVLSAIVSITAGLAGGLLFFKLAELFLMRMAGEKTDYRLSIEMISIIAAVIFFGIIFALILVVSLARLRLTDPLELLKSEAAGEKPPKANWFLAAAGVVILGFAYYLAVSIESPLVAIEVFFLAVLMVILATYLLFIAGSVVMCRILQKNRKYYYRPDHFVSVSSMAFRMKRNGAGLASICILATMVLVMLSSTGCLYLGGEDSIRASYPYDLTVRVRFKSIENFTEENKEKMAAVVREKTDGRAEDIITYLRLDTSGIVRDGVFSATGAGRGLDATSSKEELESIKHLIVMPLSDYNRLAGKNESLSPGEALVWTNRGLYEDDTFAVEGCRILKVKDRITELPVKVSSYDAMTEVYAVIVPDWHDYTEEMTTFVESGYENYFWIAIPWIYCSFNMPEIGTEEQIELDNVISLECYDRLSPVEEDRFEMNSDSYAWNRADFFSTYGALFFLGIILSIVFIAAAALIIYYKQLSEGYEDQSRFGIMQKVGMTDREIKSTVNSQVLTVFFAPLILAGVHLGFAFPFLEKILRIFGVDNRPLLIGASLVCFMLFAFFYICVFRWTAHAYYSIVKNGIKE